MKPPAKRVRARSIKPQAATSTGQTGGFAPSWAGANSGLYPVTPDSTQRGWRPQLDRDAAYLISRYKHKAMLSDARYVYAGLGEVAGAIHDKANFVAGGAWLPVYKGADKRFREAFNEVICSRWVRNCDMRGSQSYDWQGNVWRSSVSLDRDGELFIILTRSEIGAPRLQFLESHRIGSDGWLDLVPKEAPKYVGRRICNGIVYDDFMRPLAYNLLSSDSPSGSEWNFLPAEAVIHVMDPKWFSQSRGIPTVCSGILDWYDIGEIRDAEKIGVKASSRIALIESNDTGKADLGAAAMRVRTGGDVSQIEANSRLIESGLIRYFKANTGQKLEAFASDRPSTAWTGFVEHVARSAHRGMDWPIEMHDMSKVGGASVRAVAGQVQRSVKARQDAMWFPLMSAVLYAVSNYMKAGQLPMVEDWMNISFTLPAKFSVDIGRDSQNRRQDVAMGLRGLDEVLGEEGEGDIEAVFNTRASIWKLREVVAKKHGVPVEAIYNPGAASVQAAATIGENTVWAQQEQDGSTPAEEQ